MFCLDSVESLILLVILAGGALGMAITPSPFGFNGHYPESIEFEKEKAEIDLYFDDNLNIKPEYEDNERALELLAKFNYEEK